MTDTRSAPELKSKHDQDAIIKTMKEAGIPSASIAFVSNHGNIQTEDIALSGKTSTKNTVFGAASLSKPVFSYLVLKLIEDSGIKFNLSTKLNDILLFNKFCEDNNLKWDGTHLNWIEKMTVGMALSHTTGFNVSRDDKVELLFSPDAEYAYSNYGLFYLQKVIEALTAKPLEDLAQEYVFNKIGMNHSTFYKKYGVAKMPEKDKDSFPGIIYIRESEKGLRYKVIGLDGELKEHTIPWDKLPKDFPRDVSVIVNNKDEYLQQLMNHTARAGHTSHSSAVSVFSLFTTAYDYALFVKEWMALRKKQDPLMELAFEPAKSMTTDKWAKEFGVPKEDLERLASGLTWELEMDDTGKKALRAYKTGDMNMWRAWVAMDFEKDTAIIYFANSENGHLLADKIVLPNVELEHAPNFFFTKWGFARNTDDPNWKEKEKIRIGEIIAYERGYGLERMPQDSSKCDYLTIYINNTDEGLHYKVFAPNGELKEKVILWVELPNNFPKNSSDIIENKEKYLPLILKQTLKEGHTRQPRSELANEQTHFSTTAMLIGKGVAGTAIEREIEAKESPLTKLVSAEANKPGANVQQTQADKVEQFESKRKTPNPCPTVLKPGGADQ